MIEKRNKGSIRDEEDFSDLRETLRSVLPPWREADPLRDLWPAMSRRLQQPPTRTPWLMRVPWPAHIPWFDWALLGIATATLLFFPALIPALLYHF